MIGRIMNKKKTWEMNSKSELKLRRIKNKIRM